jgi:hypothetical protein
VRRLALLYSIHSIRGDFEMQLRLAEAVTRAPGRPARGYKSATSPERSRGLSPNKMQCSVL